MSKTAKKIIALLITIFISKGLIGCSNIPLNTTTKNILINNQLPLRTALSKLDDATLNHFSLVLTENESNSGFDINYAPSFILKKDFIDNFASDKFTVLAKSNVLNEGQIDVSIYDSIGLGFFNQMSSDTDTFNLLGYKSDSYDKNGNKIFKYTSRMPTTSNIKLPSTTLTINKSAKNKVIVDYKNGVTGEIRFNPKDNLITVVSNGIIDYTWERVPIMDSTDSYSIQDCFVLKDYAKRPNINMEEMFLAINILASEMGFFDDAIPAYVC